MFVPLYDYNTLKTIKFQYVTLALIAINVAVFTFEAAGVDQSWIASFAVVPSELFQVDIFGGPAPVSTDTIRVPESYTLLTYMFLHGDVFHLAGNMLFLWVFGDNVEDAMGHLKYLLFYVACGVVAGLTHAAVADGMFGTVPKEILVTGIDGTVPAGSVPLIGASGAVAGVIAAYLMLHPRVRVWVLAFRFIPLRIYAFVALGLWVLMQIAMVLIPQAGPVAWWAHIGGLAAGALLVVFLRRPGIPLFDRGLEKA